MANEQVPVERLRAYLSEMAPEARALLIKALDRNALQGASIPGAEIILEALRPALSRGPAQPPRIGNPARLFFRPLEPFLVDPGPARDLPGRIERTSLAPLWEWVGRDLLPEEASAFSRQASDALLAGDAARGEALASAFRAQVTDAITRNLGEAGTDNRLRRRMTAQIALPRAVASLQTMHGVLRHRAALEQIGAKLPTIISNLDGFQLDNVIGLIRRSAAGSPDLLLLALILVMNRLGASWQLIRLAIRSAESDLAQRVAQSALALAVTLVLAELRCAIEELRGTFRSGRLADAPSACRKLHDAIRAVRTELDLSADTAWSREFASVRSDIADLLEGEIEATPGLVRRLLRPRPARDIISGARLEELDVAEAEARIALAEVCRHCAGELALNQVAPRVHAELRQYFDTGTPGLLDSLRGAAASDRPYRQSQVDAAMRFAGRLFGAEYATLLGKAAAIAAADSKALRA